MRKIRIIEHISLDGVIQAPGGPNEDGDYPYGGWAVPHSDEALGEAIVAAHGDAFDLLLGRRTYDIWSAYWPKAESSPMADSINAATKYVATHRPQSLEWGPVEDKRFFSDAAPARELALVGTKAALSGVVISTYRPSGDLRTGSFDDEEA